MYKTNFKKITNKETNLNFIFYLVFNKSNKKYKQITKNKLFN